MRKLIIGNGNVTRAFLSILETLDGYLDVGQVRGQIMPLFACTP